MKTHVQRHSVVVAVVGGGVIFASAIAGFFFFTHGTGSSAGDRYQTGTIQLARDGSTCQRLVIDNSTGTLKPGQQVPCGDAPKDAPKEAARTTVEAPPRYSSGGRVDAVRDSFRNR